MLRGKVQRTISARFFQHLGFEVDGKDSFKITGLDKSLDNRLGEVPIVIVHIIVVPPRLKNTLLFVRPEEVRATRTLRRLFKPIRQLSEGSEREKAPV